MDTWRTNSSTSLPGSGTSMVSNVSQVCVPYPGVYNTIWGVLGVVSVIVGFPSCVALTWQLVQRQLRAGGRQGTSASSSSSSSSPIDIYLRNFIGLGFVYEVSLVLSSLSFLSSVDTMRYSLVLIVFCASASMLFMAAICVDCYLAVVHPVTYMVARGTWQRALLFSALVLGYSVTLAVVIGVLGLSVFHPVCMLSYYVTLPVIVFCNGSTLRVLWLARPGSGARVADLNPAKSRALRVVLTMLAMVVGLLPMPCVHGLMFTGGLDDRSIWCVVFPVLMLGPTLNHAAMPFLFLYSLDKLACRVSLPCSIPLKIAK